ncbi:MAG TPA: hypothetical protein VL995_11240 [Cellvibrio sp.]|nr:hypothetical protein [Cellvibrio sp.]
MMKPKRKNLLLSSASLVFIAVSFFVISAQENRVGESDFLALAIASYELILAAIENGNLKSESGDFFLTVYKWAAFLKDIFND